MRFLFRSLLFFFFVPVLCLGVVPIWVILSKPALFSFGILGWLALPLWIAGWAVMLVCTLDLALRGRGTPNPFDPPVKLVMTGPYSFVRNPIYVGSDLVLIGYVFWHPNLQILLMLLIAVLAEVLFVRYYEEPHLRRAFGPVYERYCKAVPPWIPRLNPRTSNRTTPEA